MKEKKDIIYYGEVMSKPSQREIMAFEKLNQKLKLLEPAFKDENLDCLRLKRNKDRAVSSSDECR